MLEYKVYYNNELGKEYDGNWTNQNLYQVYRAVDLSRPSAIDAGIKEFKYAIVNTENWNSLIPGSTGIANWTQTNEYNGKIYMKASDLDNNESETLSYILKIDRTAPVFYKPTIRSTNTNYHVLDTILSLNAVILQVRI